MTRLCRIVRMSLRLPLLALTLAVVGLAATSLPPGSAPALAQVCGNDLQPPCSVDKVRAPCYSCWGSTCGGCFYTERVCRDPQAFINNVNSQDLCFTLPNYAIPTPTAVSFTDKGKPVTNGYQVTVDLTQAWIVIPRPDQSSSCATNAALPSTLAVVGPDPNEPSMPVWATSSVYGVRLAVNGSFFEVNAPKSDPNNWHSWVCTHVFGYTLSNKALVRPEEKILAYQGNAPPALFPTATLVFYTSEGAKTRGREADIKNYPMFPGDPSKVPDDFQNAISGTQLLTNGVYVGDTVAAPEPQCRLPRTAAGLTADGNHLILVVVNPGDDNFVCNDAVNGTTLGSMAAYIKSLGAYNAISLDGGGSAQMFYQSPRRPTIQTKPSDYTSPISKLTYRPVGNMLGIR
jgi:hypothetical protein